MDSYVFTYRRMTGRCKHCDNIELQSVVGKFLAFFRSSKKKIREKAKCEFEWKNFTVIGHGPENYSYKESSTSGGQRVENITEGQNLNKMVLYFPNGALKTIANWDSCELKLDVDWVLFTKRRMEKESGQDIKLSVNTDHKVDM